MRYLFISSFCFLLAQALTAATGPEVRDGEVAARLVSPFSTVKAGQTVPVGVRYQMDENWHTYWRNSGDTGLPTNIDWTVPEGSSVGQLHWPYPKTYRNASLVDFVYFDSVTLYTTVTIPEDWPEGKVFPLSVATDWLMCEEICIPGSAELTLELPVEASATEDPSEQAQYEATVLKWPATVDGVSAEMRVNGDLVQVVVTGLSSPPENLSKVFLFPVDPIVASSGEQTWQFTNGRLIGSLQRSEFADTIPERTDIVLFAPEGWPIIDGRNALAATAVLLKERPILIGGTNPEAGESKGMAGLLLLAFLGGAILNLMPCVFPVLGLKIMGFVEKAGSEKKKIVSHGLLFTLGVMVSFWILAGVLLGLRAGGAELGWGFQLQSPVFVFGMTAFLLLFALNLSGVFEIGFGIAAAGARAEKGEGPFGSFLSGVLATVVATPCSAPFLATALAGALTLPPAQSFLTFTFIALGLAGPYLLLCLFPSLLKKLPKPGAWMETLKQFMAFPLYATVGWLVYVLAGQVEADNFLNVLLSLTLLALAAWVYGRFASPHRPLKTRRVSWIAALLLLAGALVYGYPRESTLEWTTWSPETVEELREENRLIYVDFTARWCATCQVNKAVVFSSEEVLNFIQKNDVALLKADWTNEDPKITRRLTELGKAAVPVTLVYLPSEAQPRVLPETLTPGIVLKALQGAD